MVRGKRKTTGLLLLLCFLLSGCGQGAQISFDLSSVPEFDGDPYVVLNDNIPEFKEEEKTTEVFARRLTKHFLLPYTECRSYLLKKHYICTSRCMV